MYVFMIYQLVRPPGDSDRFAEAVKDQLKSLRGAVVRPIVIHAQGILIILSILFSILLPYWSMYFECIYLERSLVTFL